MNDSPATLSRSRFRFLCALLFCTGMTSLIFQIIWLRGFSIILGSTIYSMACVVTVFMLGLALGSLIMSRLLKNGRRLAERPLAAYGTVELLVGLSSLLVTWTLFTHQDFYLSLSGSPTAPLLARLAAQFSVCLALIGIPTALMGMTLPLLSQLVADRRQVSALYGVNTIGAATGSIISSFVLIYYLGCIRAGAVATAINALIFTAALLGNRFFPPAKESAAEEPARAPPALPRAEMLSRPLMLALALFSGFVALSCEITWTRFLSLCFGNRIYVTSITLAIILLFMGQAARMSSAMLRGPTPLWRILLYACSLTLISFSAAFLLERSAFQPTQPGLVVGFILLMVVFPATALGLIFPLTLAARPAGVTNGASWVGLVYGMNTLASLVGSLASGYVLINLIGSNGLIAFNSVLLLVALAGLAYAFRPSSSSRTMRWAEWRCSASLASSRRAASRCRRWWTPRRQSSGARTRTASSAWCAWMRPGCGAEQPHGPRLPLRRPQHAVRAGVPGLPAHPLRAEAGEGAGHRLGLRHHRGRLLARDGGDSIDAVEIVPALVEHAKLFSPGNHDYFTNPRVQIHVTDGRHFLATTPERYDIISINVSDPYLPGSSSFFSREFYELARSRLSPGACWRSTSSGRTSPRCTTASTRCSRT